MISLTTSMSSAFNAFLPKMNVETEVTTAKEMANILARITMVNQVLQGLLTLVEQDPTFWRNVDMAVLRQHFAEHRGFIKNVRVRETEGSRAMALLDSMESNILKLEKHYEQSFQFNFDLARMEDRVNDKFVSVPKFDTFAEFDQWLMEQ